MELEKKRTNIVIHGLKEHVVSDIVNLDDLPNNDFGKTPDQEMVEEILKAGLKLDATGHIDEVQKIGKYEAGKTRPVRIRTKTWKARNEMLKRARILKDREEFSKVYIAPDLTRKQQLLNKDLRTHVKKFKDEDKMENVRIISGKVVQIVPGNPDVVLYQPAPTKVKLYMI